MKTLENVGCPVGNANYASQNYMYGVSSLESSASSAGSTSTEYVVYDVQRSTLARMSSMSLTNNDQTKKYFENMFSHHNTIWDFDAVT